MTISEFGFFLSIEATSTICTRGVRINDSSTKKLDLKSCSSGRVDTKGGIFT